MGEQFRYCAIALAAMCATPAAASPWNRDDGRLFIATTSEFYQSKTPISRYWRADADTYIEFGITPNWMTGGRFSYGTSNSETLNGAFTESGINETSLYLQRQIKRGSRSASAVKITAARAGRLSVDAQTGIPSPNMEAEVRGLYGRDLLLEPFKIFATAEVAYRRRFGGDADQIRTDLLVGVEPTKRLLILLEGQSIVSLQNETAGFADYDLYKGQGSIVWKVGRKWSIVGGARKEFQTRNIVPGTAYFVGVWTTF